MASSDQRHLRHDSLPVVDLRLLSQSELLSLSHFSSQNDNDANTHQNDNDNDDGVLIPKIDRSVFNESAGSRKQTYSRLRLAPSAAVAARRAQSQAPEPPDPDSFQIIGLLKQLFAPDSQDRLGLSEDAVSLLTPPVEIFAGDSAPEVDRANPEAVPSSSVPRGFPTEIVLGLFQCDNDEFAKPKRGRPMKNPAHPEVKIEPEGFAAEDVSLPVPSDVVSGVDSEKQNPVANSAAENNGGGFGTADWGNRSSGSVGFGDVVAPFSTPFPDTVSSDPAKVSQELIPQHPTVPNSPANVAADVPAPLPNMVSNSQAMDIDPEVGFTDASRGGVPPGGGGKRKRGRPRKGESGQQVPPGPVSSPKVKVKKAVVVRREDLEKVNASGEVVDLAVLGSLKDPFGEELRRRTEGLATEAELMGYLGGIDGDWGSWRRKKKVVQASEFGNSLPKGWKLQLCPKRRDGRVWLICRRYISPGGEQFVSCEEVSSYLLASFRLQDEGKSESGLAHADFQVANKVGSQIDADVLFDDQKNADGVASSSRVPNTSALNDHRVLSHTDLSRCDSTVNDGVIFNEGKYQCQLQTSNYAEGNGISQGLTSIPEKSDPVSSCILPTSSKMQKSVGIDEEELPSLEENDKLDYGFLHGNMRVDTPSENCMEKERAEAVSGTCIYGQRESFDSFSHEQKVTNGCKSDKGQEVYGNQAKPSYLTNEELRKLDEPWPEMGFQSNEYTPLDVDIDLNNSYSDVVDMITVDDSRNYNASELSVSFDGKYGRIDSDTVSRMQQEEISKGSSALLSSYECEYAFKDSLLTNRKAAEAELDRSSSRNDPGGRSENAQSYSFTNNTKIPSSSSVEKSRNVEVKNFWNGAALHASGSIDCGMDANAGKSTVVDRSSERISQVISGSGQTFSLPNEVSCNPSNRAQELKPTRGSEFGLIYPSGTEKIHGADNTQSMFTSSLWEQPKLAGENQFRNNELATGSMQYSRHCGDDMPEIIWRTDGQNFQPSRLNDTSSTPMQMSGCYPNFNLLPDKDPYGDPSVSERFDDIAGFGGIGHTTTQQQLQYDFLSAQGTSNPNNSRGLAHKQDYDSLFWFSKEDTSLFSKPASRNQTLTICVWCRKEFYYQDVSSQMKAGTATVMCATCQAKCLG